MNGRVYLPELGVFLSPDPFLQFPESTQGYNRYAYVSNNPLSYTDPSGHFLDVLFVIYSTIQGYKADGIMGAIFGFATSMVTVGLSASIYTAYMTKSIGFTTALVAHSVTQGMLSMAGGGRFGDGALGAAASFGLSMRLPAAKTPAGNVIRSAVIGGTVSRIAGGKFGNGAASAAFLTVLSGGGPVSANKGEKSRQSRGWWIFPNTGSKDLNTYYAVATNGILGDEQSFRKWVNSRGIPGYFNPSRGLIADSIEAIGQTLFGAHDQLARGFAAGLANVDHSMKIIAHSQGTLTVTNAALYFGLPEGSEFYMLSPAYMGGRMNAAVRANGGTLHYRQPWGDGANLWAPSLNPLQTATGILDVFCNFCRHRANGLY